MADETTGEAMTNKHSMREVVRETIQSLYDTNGQVVASQLVEAARPKSHPAHAAFEWDNKRAGDAYRLWQARAYIRVVKVRRAEAEERLIHVPRVVTAPSASADEQESREGHYQVPSVLVTRPDEFSRALHQARAKLDAAKRALDELYGAADATDRADQAALIAQMAKATEMWSDALKAMH
jgi:hypothetical protein